MPNELISLIPPGKLRCCVTGILRNDTPEENVRQRIARSLVENYEYPAHDLAVEFPIKLGRSRKRADLVIFPAGATHTQENAYIIAECKREDVRPTDASEGVEQLKSYLAACLNARFGMWVGAELQVWEKSTVGRGRHKFDLVADIPRVGSATVSQLTFADLVPGEDELISVFKRCHNYIYGNQGLQKEPAFQELLKVIFCKVHDEDTSAGPMRFAITNEERRSEIGQRRLRQRLESLFDEVKGRYPYIFAADEHIRLDNRVMSYVVGELQRYSLLQTRADVKGAAYEQLVGANLRGDRGEYFTPRNVCDMAARMVLATHPPEHRTRLRILDPACGTGGFLVSTLLAWRDRIHEQQLRKWRGNEAKAALETARQIKELAGAQLFGVDFNPVLARAAQMNLVMHGDGSTNVFHANSLLPPGEWPDEPPNEIGRRVGLRAFDVVLTNPPFGARIAIDDPHILEQFELSRFETETGQRRGSMAPEQLFIERCLAFLKPGGRLAIVLPDSILSNPGLAFIRRWLLTRARIIASVDLPQVTFEPYTGTQTSVLIAQKFGSGRAERRLPSSSYDVFMAMPEAVGHDRRGQPVFVRTADGEIVEQDEEIPVYRRLPNGDMVVERRHHRRKAIQDDLPEVVRLFTTWAGEPARREWLNA